MARRTREKSKSNKKPKMKKSSSIGDCNDKEMNSKDLSKKEALFKNKKSLKSEVTIDKTKLIKLKPKLNLKSKI